MKNNYWDCNKLINATKEEKEELLSYEIWMFRKTRNQLQLAKKQFEINLLVESLATHTRILIDFFYNDKNKKYPNDLVAQDFLYSGINWKNKRPSITKLLTDAKNKADKQLAHLSLWRVKLKKDNKKGWNLNLIKTDIEKIIKKFESLKNK